MTVPPNTNAPPPVSTAADFAEPETFVVALPRPGPNGKSRTVRCQAIPLARLIKEIENIPGIGHPPEPGATPTFEDTAATILNSDGPNRKVAAAGLVEPAFYFDGVAVDGKANWDDLHFEDQSAIVAEIVTHSFPSTGTGAGVVGGAADAASFRPVAE